MTDVIEQIEEIEKSFSVNGYDGEGRDNYKIIGGNIPVILSAPHAVNHFRDGSKKWADVFTGGIACYLQKVTGCHLICGSCFTEKDPNFDLPDDNEYQLKLKQYLRKMSEKNQPIRVLLDIHGASASREYAVEIGTAPAPTLSPEEKDTDLTSLHGHKIVEDVVTETLKHNFDKLKTGKKAVCKNKIFTAGGQNTVTKNIAENTDTACLQLEINKEYRDPHNIEQMSALVESLQQIIKQLSVCEWNK